ncbi:MAG: SPFH domain-containing protein [Planctomycetota bacterium]|nr:SPFH domain-containing protein [Planctomycetota bacterium]
MQASKRGQRVAIFGLIVQLALVALAALLLRATGSPAAQAVLWLVILPLPLWVITLLMFYCQWLQRREAEEIQQLTERPGQTESIFRDQDGDLRPADNRLKWMQRYMVHAFTLVFAACHAVVGILLLQWVVGIGEVSSPAGKAASMFFAVGGAFAAFLVSRYAVGMSKAPSWRMLRAPGSYLFTNSLVMVLLACALAGEHYDWPVLGVVIAYVLPVFAIVIGAELVLNFVLDLYRPRLPDSETRYSYDSRLLNLIASPESIGHSIAEALNYQFGFEVSGTWFYKLLQRTFVPLLLTGAIFIWLMTSVVVVEEGQQYTVLHWGKRYPQRVLKPRRCPYLIWPWPIDTARKFETDRINQITLGVGEERTEEFVNKKRIYLWTEEHGRRAELDTLVAIPPGEGKRRHEKAPSVSIIKMVVSVYYRIGDKDDDIYRFGYTFSDAHKLLEAIAYREMVSYAASATLDEPLPADQGQSRPQGILSFGRAKAAKDLKTRIAEAAKKLDLGVQIVDVEFLSCHPPKEAAPEFEGVIAAERQQDKYRYQAQSEANKILADVAGDPDEALKLAQAISALQELQVMVNTRRSGGDVNSAVKRAIERIENEIADLEKQIHTEMLLGRHKPNESTVTQELLKRQKKHLALLTKIQSDPGGFDLARQVAGMHEEIDNFFKDIRGTAAVTIARARADRWKTEFRERARAETFSAHLMGLQAAPSLYRLDKYLNVLTEGLQKRRKYILGVDRDRIEVWLNLEEPQESMSDVPLGNQ